MTQTLSATIVFISSRGHRMPLLDTGLWRKMELSRLPRWYQWEIICLSMQETQIRSLGWEDPLEEEMATHSSILAWKIPWTEELGQLQSLGLQRVGHD